MADPKPTGMYAILAEYREALAILAERGVLGGDSLPAKLERLLAMVDQSSRRIEIPTVCCEHGVIDGDWCEPCNREYKAAIRENEGT